MALDFIASIRMISIANVSATGVHKLNSRSPSRKACSALSNESILTQARLFKRKKSGFNYHIREILITKSWELDAIFKTRSTCLT